MNARKTYKPKGKLYNLLDFVLAIDTIPGFTKFVFLMLARFSFDNDHTFISQEKLARLSQSSVRTIQRSLKRLDHIGLVHMIQDGRMKKYYMTIPADLMELAAYHQLIDDEIAVAPWAFGVGKTPAKLSPVTADDEAANAIHANLSPVSRESESEKASTPDNLSGTHDNLSAIDKILEIQDPPLTPQDETLPSSASPAPAPSSVAGGGGGSISPLEKKEDVRRAFARLAEAYPCQDDLREAFDVFRRLQGQLPPLEELLRLVEHEKANNGKWRRGYPPRLRNWLRRGEYKAAAEFMALEDLTRPEPAPRSAVTLPEPAALAAPPSQAALPELPYDEAEFEACAALWSGMPKIAKYCARGIWINLLWRGLRPGLEAARQASGQARDMSAWLMSLKNRQTPQLEACA